MAFYDGTEFSRKVLDVARGLVKVKDGELMILVLGKREHEVGELEESARVYMQEHDLEGGMCTIIEPTLQKLATAVRRLGPVALSCRDSLYGAELCELVNTIENPVLLVR